MIRERIWPLLVTDAMNLREQEPMPWTLLLETWPPYIIRASNIGQPISVGKMVTHM